MKNGLTNTEDEVVKLSEENQSQRKPTRTKESDLSKTEMKLRYLETLRQMSFGPLKDRVDSNERMSKTCDSIEADLSI